MIKRTLLILTAALGLTMSAHANIGDTYEQCCTMWFSKPDMTVEAAKDEGGGKAYVWSRHQTGQDLLILATFNDANNRCDMIEYWYYDPKTLDDQAVRTILGQNSNDQIAGPTTRSDGVKLWGGFKDELGVDGKTKIPMPTFAAFVFTYSDKSMLRIVTMAHIQRVVGPVGALTPPDQKSYGFEPVIGKKYQVTLYHEGYPDRGTFIVTYRGVDNVNKLHCGDGRGDKAPSQLGDCWFNVSMGVYEVCVPLDKPLSMSEAEFAKYKALSDKLWTEAKTIKEL